MFKRTAFAILDVITKLLQNTALASLEKLHKRMMMVHPRAQNYYGSSNASLDYQTNKQKKFSLYLQKLRYI